MTQYLTEISDNDIHFSVVVDAVTPEEAAQTVADHLVAEET